MTQLNTTPGSTTVEVALPRSLGVVVRVQAAAAGVLLLVLVGLTIADVASRNLAGRSIVGTIDISTVLLVAIAFLGLAAAEADGRHVSVELLEGRMGARTRLAFSGLRALLLLGIGILLTWGLGNVLVSALDRGETTNDILRLPTWPAKLVLLVAFLTFFVVAVWKETLVFAELRARERRADS